MRSRFIDDNVAALQHAASGLEGIAGIVGFVDRDADIYNAAALLADGRVAGVYHKEFLPNYGVFDERRYFHEGDGAKLFTIAGAKVGVTICEDLWYAEGAAQALGLAGADVVINISASPYHHGKRHFRQRMFSTRASDNAVYVAHVNLVGGQDELVFDGNSMVFDAEGELVAHSPAFEEHP
jgi:NAD+ synthase (glutamine-hydrolysing)